VYFNNASGSYILEEGVFFSPPLLFDWIEVAAFFFWIFVLLLLLAPGILISRRLD
jgi:hypothetical protein